MRAVGLSNRTSPRGARVRLRTSDWEASVKAVVHRPQPKARFPRALDLSFICHQTSPQFLLTARRKTEYLLPDFLGLHAQVDKDNVRAAANPAQHFVIHVHAQRLKVAHLAVRTENLLPAEETC